MFKKTSELRIPQIASPAGGASVRDVVSRFAPSLLTGTSQYFIPLPITQARDLTPQLTLNYNSGRGNGIFGLGFTIFIPQIVRKTTKGVPTYEDKKDTFVLSGRGDLVYVDESNDKNGWKRSIYRLEVEERFLRIEYWIKKDQPSDSFESFWVVKEGNGKNYVYGRSKEARIANNEQKEQIFAWNLERVDDAKGNRIWYKYEYEPCDNNSYIKAIHYGNKNNLPYSCEQTDGYNGSAHYLFELKYGTCKHQVRQFLK
jgi:hypothetical protein